jgi:glycosyltransferase involved in cell wall biosynthesis
MKILYHHRIRSKDGQFVHVEELIGAFRSLGHEVRVVGPEHVENEEFGADAGWVTTLKRRLPSSVYELLELGYSLHDYRKIRRAISEFRPDLVYERYNLFFPSGVRAARAAGVPILLEVNAPLYEERSRFGGLSLRRLAKWSEDYVWRNADAVLPVTDVLARRVRAAGVPDQRIHVTPNGINEREFSDLPTPEEAKRHLGLDGRFVLGFVGFMREWHGLERVLEFMATAPGREQIFALFVGDGPARAGLEARARELGLSANMRITGVMPRSRIPQTLAAFDVALQPAVVEYASPLKLFEYLAVGLPIIAPGSANIREVLANGENALLFDEGDRDSFFGALARMCRDSELRRNLARAAAATIGVQGLTWERNARRVTAIAHELACNRGEIGRHA